MRTVSDRLLIAWMHPALHGGWVSRITSGPSVEVRAVDAQHHVAHFQLAVHSDGADGHARYAADDVRREVQGLR